MNRGVEMNLRISIIAAAVGLGMAGAAFAGQDEDLIAANKCSKCSKCSKCHTATTTKKSPSFASLAAKYKVDATAADKLVAVLKPGGADEHAKVDASDADLKDIVAVVMSSK
jgi:cytochrome c551/c552